jgi:hypothetical protein
LSAVVQVPTVRLLKRDGFIPPTIETLLRRAVLDRFTGNVQLNIKDGKILGFHKTEIGSVPPAENT